ncbi:pseudouridine synthase [Garciella nitratireducens]|uniref:Pseudouridine synthase n=1 Tax=Garciella nitratireducens DSM 15102 TaxID=1121911 RepID=A0A1T4JUI5_9FIRM|nr:pseudouridine synthase [Garciella nitratireducens]RBP45584.1 23S rRNA pseudouridine2605 synthase [Garciella nitratireducens]SJZ33870.1 23S rRNA pseudouridine2605 synthase [Garciella nitratireducens DSM 15102]
MRLQKFLAYCGIGSRRKCEQYIKEGKVKVNGQIIKQLGFKIDPEKDNIEFNHSPIQMYEKKVYILLNKPVGYITTVKDQFHRKTVMTLVNNINERIYPIGRLDYNTEGLLLMTNDGTLTYCLTHPKYEIEKEYIAWLKGIPSKEKINAFKNGLKIEDYITFPTDFTILKKNRGNALVKIIIHEGRNRQIRKMCDKIGHPVISLKRIRIGKILLGDLPTGKWRYLTNIEKNYLLSIKNKK